MANEPPNRKASWFGSDPELKDGSAALRAEIAALRRQMTIQFRWLVAALGAKILISLFYSIP